MLKTTSLSKRFGSLVAVNDVDWEIARDQTTAIIGPNGAGKTTFFNLLSGVLEPTSGNIFLDGTEITGLDTHTIVDRGLVKTFQITNLYEELTVYENVRLAAHARDFRYDFLSRIDSDDALDTRVERVLEQIGIGEYRDEPIENLSYGDQRRVEVGLALATDPSVILLDEPTAGMSPDETAEFITLFDALKENEDATIVITEHDMDVIMQIADRITVLHNGAMLAEGSAEEIRNNDQVQQVYLGSGE